MQVGRVILDSDLDLDAPKHIMLMLFLLVDRKKPDSFFKVRSYTCMKQCVTRPSAITHARQYSMFYPMVTYLY